LFSGAKPLKYFDQLHYADNKFEKNILRFKPGRSDLPVNKRSLKLCCSDKIALYNILGIQGKTLFDNFIPIYIDRVIIDG
jgi:tRNA-specific adenosine deaminase 1